MRERSTFSSAASLSAHPVPVLAVRAQDAHVERAALLDVELARGQATHGLADVVALALGEEADVPEVHAEQRHRRSRASARPPAGSSRRRRARWRARTSAGPPASASSAARHGLDAGSLQLADGLVGGRHGLLAAAVGDDQRAPAHRGHLAARPARLSVIVGRRRTCTRRRRRPTGASHRKNSTFPLGPGSGLRTTSRTASPSSARRPRDADDGVDPQRGDRARRRPTRAAPARPRTAASPSRSRSASGRADGQRARAARASAR